MTENLIEVRDLKVHFPLQGGLFRKGETVQAVDGVTFDIRKGETLGLVGESGCGKTTAGRAILRLAQPTSGHVRFNGIELVTLSDEEIRKVRRDVQMIYQDPYASLNPRMTVQETLAEPITVHGLRKNAREVKERVADLLDLVGLSGRFSDRYPHEFSGGQRQRIGIARALAVEPSFLVCDEAVSALDVSVQAQIINLLEELQTKLGLTYLFIAHGLAVVKHISDRVAVMYLGKIVEMAPAEELYANPAHPYTRSLLSAVPIPDPVMERRRNRIILQGDVPSPINPPSGCRFHTRCPMAVAKCSAQEPPTVAFREGHEVACWRASETADQMPLVKNA